MNTGGETPLDFINNNLNAETASHSIDPQLVADAIAKAKGVVVPTPTPMQSAPTVPTITSIEKEPEPTFTEALDKKTEPLPTDSSPEISTSPEVSEEDDIGVPDQAAPENFKKLRGVVKEVKKTLKQTQDENAALKANLSKYESGEVVPGVVQEKEQEISRLSHFEKLHNFKASPEYQDKFMRPLTETQNKLKEIFSDYGVPAADLDAVVSKAVSTGNRAELNRFLSEHLGNDELGASEAKQLILRAREIQGAAVEAEKEPAKILARLQEDSQALQAQREVTRKTKIAEVGRSSWVEALSDIRAKKEIQELIPRSDDPSFNQNIVNPILSRASTEYGKIIVELAKAGVTEVPKELAKALATMTLLAHATPVAIVTRNRALEHTDEMTRNLTRHHTLLRPPLGGGVPNAPAAPAVNLKTTVQDDALSLINSVLAKQRA